MRSVSTPAQTVAAALRGAGDRVLVAVHARPDMDALASATAVAAALRRAGREVVLASQDPLPPHLLRVPLPVPVTCGDEAIRAATGFANTVVAIECQSPERGGKVLQEAVRSARLTVLIDHHPDCTPWADVRWIDQMASSCSELAYRVHLAGFGPPGQDVATLLLAGIAADTSWFSSRTVTPDTLATAAELVQWGASIQDARDWIAATSLRDLEEESAALLRVQTLPGGVYWTYCELAAPSVRYRILDSLSVLDGCRAAVAACGNPDGTTTVSIRVRTDQINAMEIARAFGGGGHLHSAAFTVRMPPDVAAIQAARTVARVLQDTCGLAREVQR
jgi:phosphoesterase RecJ-like protein